MAHECPDCGQACYCNGDIDDCFFENTPEANNCRHYKECEQELDEEDEPDLGAQE